MPPLALAFALANSAAPPLAARQILQEAASEPLNAGTIVAIVFAAIVPVIILAAVAAYFLGFYGRPGYWCCIPRRGTHRPDRDPPRPSPSELESRMKESGIPLRQVESQSTLATIDSLPNRTTGDLGQRMEPRTFV